MFKQKIDYKKLNEEFLNACLAGDLNTVQRIYTDHKPQKSIFRSFLRIANIETSFNPHYKKNRALTNACMMGQSHIVEFLFGQEGFKENLTSKKIQLPLQFAIFHGETELVKLLLPISKRDLSLYITMKLGFKKACYSGHLETIKYLTLNPELDLDGLEDEYALPDQGSCKYLGFLNACAGGHLEIMDFLSNCPELKEKVDIDRINQPYVTLKMEVNSLEVMNHFIFDLNLKRNDPLIRSLTIDPKIIKDVELLFDKQELFKDLNVEFNKKEEKNSAKKRSKL